MPESLRDTVDDALARAVVYRTVSAGFQPPNDERRRLAGTRDAFRVVITALRRLDQRAGGGRMARAAGRLAELPVPDVDAIATTYWRLFGHTTRGLICACETEYGPANGFHQPQQLADLNGYYLAFGLRPMAASEVRADHIACECEFMDFLHRKEALLLSTCVRWPHGPETLDATQKATRTFLRDHLGRFGRAFAAQVASEDGDGYYGALAHVLLALVDAECARVGVEAGPLNLAVRPDSTDDTPMACGTADELVQIQRRP
jgi:putative dimethyl sulfoxide reductase chaperone